MGIVPGEPRMVRVMDHVNVDGLTGESQKSLSIDPALSLLSIQSVKKPATPGSGSPDVPLKISDSTAKQMTDAINALLKDNNFSVRYQYFKNPTTLILKMVDNNTGQVVMEFPQEKALRMLQSILQSFGLLHDNKA